MSYLAKEVSSTDESVKEYLIYRGFAQTYCAFNAETGKDSATLFDALKLTDCLFDFILQFKVEEFISLWNFLHQRFYLHLEVDYLLYSSTLKLDIYKFYLANCSRFNFKDKMTDFFAKYTQEMITLSSQNATDKEAVYRWYLHP